MEVKLALNPQTGGNDLSPNAHQDLRWEVSFVSGQQPSQDRCFTSRSERGDEHTIALPSRRLFHLGDRAGNIGSPDQKIVQGVVDPVDFAAEIFKSAGLFSHQGPNPKNPPARPGATNLALPSRPYRYGRSRAKSKRCERRAFAAVS
jgi:hypothetical protein